MQIDDATRERVERLAKVVPGLPWYAGSGGNWRTEYEWVKEIHAADIILARLLVRLAEYDAHLTRVDNPGGGYPWAVMTEDDIWYGPTPLHAAIAAAEALAGVSPTP